MEDKRDFLIKNRGTLVRNVKNVDAIVDELVGCGGLNGESAAIVWAQKTDQDRMRRILDFVSSKALAELLFNALLKHQNDVMMEIPTPSFDTFSWSGPPEPRVTYSLSVPGPPEPRVTDSLSVADFIDRHWATLVESVRMVESILDLLLDEGVITTEAFQRVLSKRTSQEKMRELRRYLNSSASRDMFYKALQELEPFLYDDLRSPQSSAPLSVSSHNRHPQYSTQPSAAQPRAAAEPIPDFIDRHWATLVERVTMVAPILDLLLEKGVINTEAFQRVSSKPTSQEKMRELRRHLNSSASRDMFYKALEEQEPFLCSDLRHPQSSTPLSVSSHSRHPQYSTRPSAAQPRAAAEPIPRPPEPRVTDGISLPDKRDFFKKNRGALVQNVTNVRAIVADLTRRGAFHAELAANVCAETTDQARMRKVLDSVSSKALAELLFNALLEHQRDVMIRLLPDQFRTGRLAV